MLVKKIKKQRRLYKHEKRIYRKTFSSVTALTCAFSIAACSKDEPTKNDDGTNGSQTEKTEYQMLGTVTHGNLYFLSKNSEEKFDTTASLQSLIGKKVGVVQLPNVPGLILKLILQKNNVPFKQIETADEAAEDKVNLLAISSDNAAATIVANAENYDCFVAADPLVTLKTKQNLFRSGSLQALYGENGYPQAVIVGKSAFLKQYPEWTNKFMEKLSGADEYLAETDAAAILAPYTAAYTADGRTGSWNAKNLNAASVANCNVKFEASATCKTAVTTIVTEMFEIQRQTAPTLTDAFFYLPPESGVNTMSADMASFMIAPKTPEETIVYSPDGAPALILAELMAEGTLEDTAITCKIVSPDTIGTYVSYQGDQQYKNADFCILPVNMAAKLLGR